MGSGPGLVQCDPAAVQPCRGSAESASPPLSQIRVPPIDGRVRASVVHARPGLRPPQHPSLSAALSRGSKPQGPAWASARTSSTTDRCRESLRPGSAVAAAGAAPRPHPQPGQLQRTKFSLHNRLGLDLNAATRRGEIRRGDGTKGPVAMVGWR